MPRYMDVDGVIVETDNTIRGTRQNTDGSISFKLVGGPLHSMSMRVYPPFDTISFPRVSGGKRNGMLWYDLNPPLKPGGAWSYVYDAIRSEGTDADRS